MLTASVSSQPVTPIVTGTITPVSPVSGVYAIRNTRTGAAYVGSTVDLEHRWQVHRALLTSGTHYNAGLQSAWNHDGPEAFSIDLLEALPRDSSLLNTAESRWFERLQAEGTTLFADRHRPRLPLPTLVATPSLRYWRTQLAVPQRELAEMARVSIHTIQRLEAGGPARLSTIRRLADALEVKPADLMAEPPER